jgi:RimJ/RimL family protein N-acetyltransferase
MRLDRVTLRGRHVTLEPLAPEHAPSLLAAAEPSRRTYAYTLVPADLAGMEAYVAFALDEEREGRALPFAVRDATGAVVGSTRFLSIERFRWPTRPLEPDAPPDAVEIGHTWYAERVQRTALNTEAKLLLCVHAFEHWRVCRVTWKTDARNARSRAAIARLGAQLDGVLRAFGPAADGGLRDAAFYSMLAAEWPACKARLIERLAAPAQALQSVS